MNTSPSVTLIACLLFSLTACTSPEKQAAELLDTARFEEKQSNLEHATKLYQEAVAKYPQTQAGKAAAERLKQLQEKKP